MRHETRVDTAREVPRLEASGRFRRYKREDLKPVRSADIADDAAMRCALRVWETIDVFSYNADSFRQMEGMDYSPEDIQRFCLFVKRFEEGGGMVFQFKLEAILNRMLSTSSHQRFELSLDHLEARLKMLGESNRKDLIIRGSVANGLGWRMVSGSILIEGGAGNDVGQSMEGGTITVNGPVGYSPGNRMEGGLIVINGDVEKNQSSGGDGVGYRMSGGRIIVNGDACGSVLDERCYGKISAGGVGQDMSGGEVIINGFAHGDIGVGMSGGEIHLNGGYGNIPAQTILGGRIFHKGKLIFDR